ncbi:TPA: phage tail spike protein [Streptococcus suis]
MIYLFDKDEKLIKIVRKSAVKTALQKYALTTERYVSDRLTVELKGLNADELEQVEYMAIQTMEDAHTFHYFYVAQKFSESLTTLIGVQSGIEELRKSPVFDKRPKNALARDVITDLLAGTNWQARFVGETTPHSTNFYYTSIFDALKKVCEVWDLEMQFFVEMNGNRIGARYIDFKQRIGEAVGKRVVYGHNALQILQEVERTNIFTALVGRGKGEETDDGYGRKITFENVVWSRTQGKPVDKPKGQKYLELPLMTRQYGIKNADGSMRPKIGFVDFSEEENPEVLIERTYKALIDAARPQLTLKTSSVYLRGVKVGDTIRVVRHDKKLDYDTRVFEITFNRLNNQSSDIKLGDRIGESNEAKAQTIADKAVEQFVTNEFSNFVQNLPDYLPSADGFNNNWYGAEDPTVKYPGKVLINNIWYKPDPEHEGHKIILRWTGEVWEEILRTYDSEALRDRIAEDIAQVNQSMQAQSEEHDRQVANILSKTQSIESLANQAKSDAANALARANQVKTEAIADARAQVATVSQALNTAKSELQTAIASADQKARDSQASATALRNDLNLQASKILEQAQAQTALTSRVTTVETLADGTRSTVAELSKTVSKATGDITSVTSRTKTVEDTLSQTRTQYEALTQTVNTQTGQIDSINRKTADLQSGIDGVTERFESLQVGGRNYILNSDQFITSGERQFSLSPDFIKHATGGRKVTVSLDVELDNLTSSGSRDRVGFEIAVTLSNNQRLFLKCWRDGMAPQIRTRISATHTIPVGTTITTINYCGLYVQLNGTVSIGRPKVEISTIATDFTLAEEDLRSEIATYVRNAAENSAELSRQIQLVDGKAVEAKTYAQQTADAINTRLESLETYKNEEGTRASRYFSASRDETARQLSAMRTEVTDEFVAKATYEENARSVIQRFESLQVGGNNLLKNTKDFSGEWDYNGQRRKIAPWKYNGLSAIEVDYPWEGLTQLIQVRAGEVYTFSVYVASSLASDSAEIYIHLNNYRTEQMAVVDNYYRKFNMTATFQRVSITFKVITDGYIAPRIERSDLNGILYFAGMKLERGTIATDWSPSPEDATNYADTKIAEYKHTVDGRFATIQSSVDNKANLIDFQRVQETAKLYERILGASENEVNSNLARQVLTSSLWQTEITRLPRAGGKNYFLNSNFKEGLQFWENNTSSPDLSIDPQLASQVKRVGALHVDTGNTGAFAHGFYQIVDMPVSANEQVTVSFDVAAFPNNDAGLIIIVNNHLFDVRKEIPAAEIPKTNSFGPTSLKRKAVTLTIPNDCDRICCIIIFGPGTVGNMVFADMQIEKGGAASDYRPNPTDANRELEAVTTRVTQLAGSWAVKNLTSSGKVLNQLNLNKDGSVKIDGSLVQITGRTYIQDGIISAAKIGDLDAGKIKTGTLDAARIRANSIDGSKIVFDQAFLNKMTANEALFKQLFAQSAFITSVQAVAVSAKQIAGGIAKALNGGMDVNFDESKINFYTNVAAIRRIYTGHPTQFIKFETEGNYSRTIIGSNRNGGEVFNSATFAGIVVENTNNINTEDNVRIYGDNTLLRHAQGDAGWNINSVTQRIVPANMNAESEIWSKHFVAPDKNSKPVRLDTAVAALWDIWNHIIYNNFEFNAALRTHIKARRDNWKFELNL